jgi:hypothetical protein
METEKVTIDYSKKNYTDAELSVKAGNIVENMTGNPNFTTPIPALADISATIVSYNAALVTAEKGSMDDRVIKNSWRSKLESQLQELSLYVQLTSKGDGVIISSSGLDVNKKRSAVGPMAKPENVIIKVGGNKGSVVISCDPIDLALFYEIDYAEVTTDGVYDWVHKTSTKHYLLIEGLTSGKQYAFRIAAAGTDPSRVWSGIITSFVI